MGRRLTVESRGAVAPQGATQGREDRGPPAPLSFTVETVSTGAYGYPKKGAVRIDATVMREQVSACSNFPSPSSQWLAFSSLSGILKGKIASTEKEIDEALYRKPGKGR